jgi:hypothetical protein
MTYQPVEYLRHSTVYPSFHNLNVDKVTATEKCSAAIRVYSVALKLPCDFFFLNVPLRRGALEFSPLFTPHCWRSIVTTQSSSDRRLHFPKSTELAVIIGYCDWNK